MSERPKRAATARTCILAALRRLLAVTVVLALAELAGACTTGSNGGVPSGGSPTTGVQGGGAPNGGATDGSGTNNRPSGARSSPAGSPRSSPGPGDSRPVVGNIELSPQNVRCTYVPHGNLDGSDGLTVFAYTLLIGTNSLPGPVKTTMSISNGYSTTYTGSPSNSAAHAFQGPIRSTDWGQPLRVSIRADSDDRYRETSEADNSIQVTVNLPATRLDRTVDPLSCSAKRA
jgi:hypothetical protein